VIGFLSFGPIHLVVDSGNCWYAADRQIMAVPVLIVAVAGPCYTPQCVGRKKGSKGVSCLPASLIFQGRDRGGEKRVIARIRRSLHEPWERKESSALGVPAYEGGMTGNLTTRACQVAGPMQGSRKKEGKRRQTCGVSFSWLGEMEGGKGKGLLPVTFAGVAVGLRVEEGKWSLGFVMPRILT